MHTNFAELKGKTLKHIAYSRGAYDDHIRFETNEGVVYKMYHRQACCETVDIEDITGDLTNILGSEILEASEETNRDNPKTESWHDSHTWTFYKIRTIKGSVTIRWYGESNGYYSESVSFVKMVS